MKITLYDIQILDRDLAGKGLMPSFFVFKYQGLKKVTNDMKTHKNPELRKQVKPVSSSPKPYKAPAAAKPVAAAKPAQVKKPASTQLNMKRWDVVSDQQV